MELLLLVRGKSRPVNYLNVVLRKLLRDLAGKEFCVTGLELPGAISNLLKHFLRT